MIPPRSLVPALLGPAALLLGASAACAERPTRIDLPAGTLGQALIALSRQANENIGTPDPLLPLHAVSAVRGRLTTRQALDQLLAHTDAEALPAGPRSWRIIRRPRKRAAPRPAAPAAPPPEPRQPTIVVIGKRPMPLSDFPGTGAILSGDALAPSGGPAGSEAIENRLSSVASTHFGSGRDKIFLRGIADSGFTGPSQSTTGQYLDDTRLTYNAPDPNLRLYDIARVEILEGPQGALYGAGSLGGVMRVSTIAPQLGRFSARVSTGVAATAHGAPSHDLAGVVNLPLNTDTAALRIVGYAMQDGGYIDDPVGGRKDINRVRTGGGRAGLRLVPGDWTIDIDALWQGIHGRDSQWTDACAPPLDRLTGGPLGYRSDFVLGSMTLSRQWDDLALVSTTSATHQYLLQHYDASLEQGPPITARQTDRISLFANETRLSRQGKDGAGWMIGISLLHNRSVLDRLTTDSDGGTTPHQYAVNSVWEETLFGEAGFRLPAGLLLTAGARLTNALTHGNATAFIETTTIPIFGSPVSGSGAQDRFRVIPTIALSYRPADDLMLFLRYQQGFRPGGFGISNAHAREYDGDRISTVEAGMRMGDGSRPVQVAATLSYSRWNDILAEVVTLSGDPITQNIGDGRILAFEARAAWRPVAGLSLDASLFVNRSRLYRPAFASIVVEHNALPNVARFSAQGGFEYSLPLKHGTLLSLTGNGRYFGGSHLGAGPILDAAQGDYFSSDLLLSLSRGARAISLGVSNPFDARGNRFALGTPYRIYDSQATPLRPLTVRLGLDVRL